MRSLFSGASPARLKGSNSRDSQDKNHNDSKQQRRAAFAFMKYSPDRRSSASMRASREHARQIAMKLNTTGDSGPDFQPDFPPAQAAGSFDFNPFGHEPAPAAAPVLQEDLFAQAPKEFQQPQQFHHASTLNHKNSQSSHRSSGTAPNYTDSFGDDTSVTSSSAAYDMDFLPAVQPRRPSSVRGRPPRRNRAPASETSFASSSFSQPSAPKSMSTFPSNSSMQSSFTTSQHQHPPSTMVSPPPSMIGGQGTPGGSAGGGAAARRRMRASMRQGSSGGSVCGSDVGSVDGTPPASPSTRKSYPSNISVGSSNGGSSRNRVQNYSVQGTWQQAQSPSTSVRGGGASVCSSINGSEADLFDSNGEGGFTFDAFGLDPHEIDREVQEAMNALASSGNEQFAAFGAPKPQDTSADDFAPQTWDSPQGSRRSSPTVEEDDGFVDGFRVSKPSPLPLVSVQRESPTTSERSSSLSSITDQNVEGAPRRNMFKEKAGLLSSASRVQSRASPVQPPKKQWKPPPGAIKLMTPTQQETQKFPLRKQPQHRHQQQNIKTAVSEEETQNYWSSQINQVPSMPTLDETQQQQPPARQSIQSAPRSASRSQYQRPTEQQSQSNVNFEHHFEVDFGGEQEEKKDDDASEDKDNHTATTAAMTDVVSESQPKSPTSPSQTQVASLKKENLDQLDLQQQQDEYEETKALSPREQRKKELEDLRNGIQSKSLTSSESAAKLHSVPHDAKKITPQQQRAMECNSQRTSFGSFKERLRSPVGHGGASPVKKPQFSPRQNDESTQSEVGVSSFTRQKMKLASMSSGAKSEVAARQMNQHQTSEVSAVMNRIRSNLNGSKTGPERGAQSNIGQRPGPAFMEVKLRKASTTESAEHPDSEVEQQEREDKRERPGLELREEQQRQLEYGNAAGGSPRGYQLQAQQTAQKDGPTQHTLKAQMQQQHQQAKLSLPQHQYQHLQDEQPQQQQHVQCHQARVGHVENDEHERQDEKPPSPKKLTYRERRELEKQKEEEAQRAKEKTEQNQDHPKRDVANLIRQRIAANKSKQQLAVAVNEDDENQDIGFSKDRLRPTGRSFDDRLQPTASSGSYKSYDAPQDEMDASHYIRPEQQLQPQEQPGVSPRAMNGAQDDREGYHAQKERVSPMQSATPPYPPTRKDFPQTANHQSYLSHAQDSNQESSGRGQSLPPPSFGGISALHSQLKQLKKQDSQEEPSQLEQRHGSFNEDQELSGEKSAPRRVQAMVEGKNPNLDVQIPASQSQASETHSSPTRTPKATVAMLNAFLHGRESIYGDEEAAPANDDEQQEGTDDKAAAPGSPPKSPNRVLPANDGRPPLKDDPKYARYFSMMKIGLPLEVVKHAMQRDGLDPAVMDGDHNKPACVGIPMKDDPKYAKYFKMLKIGMPIEAVKHAMERDGLDSHVMDQDHNLPADPSQGKKDEGPKEKDSHRRARLHWKPLDKGKVRSNSLWAKIDEDPEMEQIEIDEEEFAELFQAEIQPNAEPKVAKKKGSPKKGAAVRVIDPKRANNGGIILARLKMSHDDMADVVDRIDENSMTAEQIEHIIEYLPSREERRALEAYMLEGGQDAAEKFDGLCECEKFMVSMMTVKHAKRKVRALLFKLQFESCLEALYRETHTVESSCDELSNSIRLRQLLGIVLTFGNRLNTAGKGGKKKKAGAFTLDSLLKLNQAKAFDKKTTFLQYIVLIVQRNNELLLRFKDDLPTVLKADKVYWDQCISDLEEVENQLENVRRIALYQARQASKFRMKKKKHHHEGDDDEESLTDLSLSLEEEVEALRSTPIGLFTLSAIKKVSFLRDRVENTKAKYKKLLEYFGEDDKHMQPHELFNIIVKFCGDFDKAKEQIYAEEKKRKREERKRNNATSQSHTPGDKASRPPTHSSSPGMLKASNMQPNASRVINDIKQRQNKTTREDVPSREEPLQLPTPQERQVQQPYGAQETDLRQGPGQAPHHQIDTCPKEGQGSSPYSSRSNLHHQEKQGCGAHHQNTPYPPQGQSCSPYKAQSNHDSQRWQDSSSYNARSNPNSHQGQGPSPCNGKSNPHSQCGEGSSMYFGQSNPHPPRGQGSALHNGPNHQNQAMPSQSREAATSYAGQDSLNVSATTEAQNKAELRKKVRMRTANRRRSVSPPDDGLASSENASNPAGPRNSAPGTPYEHSSVRRSSDPIGENNNVNNTDSGQPSLSQQGSSSNLMRSKLRNKRLMERKQKVMAGRLSPPTTTN